jgi:EAL domain-containing protein (putative c-di-GMP-specific phosphodiesterase class I)
MYRAKEGGRGRYEVADAQLHARALRQIEIEEELRAAVEAAEELLAQRGTGLPSGTDGAGLRLHYQPSYDLASGRLVAVEALLRWQHPTRGLLRPGEFLDVAEDRDLIAKLGAWVLRQACGQAAGWVGRFGDDAPDLWVNISARQLAKHELAAQVRYALSSTHLAADHLCLEITERQLLGTVPAVGSDLEDVADLGVGLAIDDFGTGYAGLDYLRRYPFRILKIDKSYVAGLGVDRTGTALTSSVINLGRTLDLTTVGEGVETAEQRDQLRALGCTLAQGYLLQAPAPPATIEALLAAPAPSTDQLATSG